MPAIQYEVTAHGGVKFAGEAPGLVDMVRHQLAHLRGIATSRRRQKLAVCRHVGVAQLLIGGMCGLITHCHEVPQHMIDDLAHEAQDTVGIRRGEDVVEVQVFATLMHGLRLARRRGRAGLDAVFQRLEVGVGEMGHGCAPLSRARWWMSLPWSSSHSARTVTGVADDRMGWLFSHRARQQRCYAIC